MKQEDLYEEIALDNRKAIEFMPSSQYCFKVDVKGQK